MRLRGNGGKTNEGRLGRGMRDEGRGESGLREWKGLKFEGYGVRESWRVREG